MLKTSQKQDELRTAVFQTNRWEADNIHGIVIHYYVVVFLRKTVGGCRVRKPYPI
jgi:hypothetical protein